MVYNLQCKPCNLPTLQMNAKPSVKRQRNREFKRLKRKTTATWSSQILSNDNKLKQTRCHPAYTAIQTQLLSTENETSREKYIYYFLIY